MQETIEFSRVIDHQDFISPFHTATKIIKKLEEIRKSEWAQKAEFEFDINKTEWSRRKDILVDTDSQYLGNTQTKLRYREYDNLESDLTYKFSSQIKKIAQIYNTMAKAKYNSDTKLEQNIYGWDIYSRNFYHQSTKIKNPTKIWPVTDWTAGYINKFYPAFCNNLNLHPDEKLYIAKEVYVEQLDKIKIRFDDWNSDISIEFAYDTIDMYPSSITKIELSWKMEKTSEWNTNILESCLNLLKLLSQ